MKKLTIVMLPFIFFYGCSGEKAKDEGSGEATSMVESTSEPTQSDQGVGKFKDVQLPAEIDQAKVARGKAIVDMKCGACHKLTEEKLVGPGWKGVTKRRQPAWILNFITNVDEMLNKDAAAQAQLEICLVRMPNQNLTDEDAFDLLDFMRNNDSQ